MNEEPLICDAALSTIANFSRHGGLRRSVQITVFQYDKWGFTAHFQ
jgi:hypothetical protein